MRTRYVLVALALTVAVVPLALLAADPASYVKKGTWHESLIASREALMRAQVNATKDRRRKKRDFRGLWIIRISAACQSRGMRYSQIMNGLKLAQVSINRKMLSEMAIHDPEGFDKLVELARQALGEAA